MLNLDLKKAQELVAECIAERGEDYVYEKEGTSCRYVHNVRDNWNPFDEDYENDFVDATPGCLVGMVLNKGGIPLEAMGTNSLNEEGSDNLLGSLSVKGFVTFTDGAASFLANAQAAQDVGHAWGPATEAAMRGQALEWKYDEYGVRTTEAVERASRPVE